MPTPLNETFSMEAERLVRSVVPRRGRPYRHTCTLAVYQNAAHAIDELAGAAFTNERIRDRIDAPFTQVMVALAFLKERGAIVPAPGRSHVAASDCVHIDALIEFHALDEKE